MNLPRFFIVGLRPVKFVETSEGGLDVLAFDWKTGEFVREMGYLTRCVTGHDSEVDEVDSQYFEQQVAELRAKRNS